MLDRDAIRNRLLAVITALLVVAGLNWRYPVSMLLAAAVFIIAAVWPIKPWLDELLASTVSYIGTILVLFVIFATFVATVYFATSQVVETFSREEAQFRHLLSPTPLGRRSTGWPFLIRKTASAGL